MTFFKDNLIKISGITKEYSFYSKTFKQFQLKEYLDIPKLKPDIEQIIGAQISAEIITTKIIPIPCSISNEGQKLTGYKMLVEGRINQKIEYVADNQVQSVHVAEFSKYFSNFIMLDPNISCENLYQVNCYIEDLYIKQINKRQIFKNVMLLLQAVPLNQPVLNTDCYDENDEVEFFSQFSVEETINVPRVKPDIKQILSTIVDTEIMSVKFINTLKGVSFEGQKLTGKKAVIELKLKQKVLYVADEPEQSIHGMETEFYTSSFVVIPECIEGTDPNVLLKKGLIKVVVTIEDIFVRQINNRSLFKNLCILIKLDIIPTYEICYIENNGCDKSDLFIMYEDGRCKVPVQYNNHGEISKINWSPLGNEFGFIESFEQYDFIMLMDINNLKPNKLSYVNNFERIYSFSFAENGRKILCSALKNHKRDIYIIDLLNKSVKNLTNNNGFIKNLIPKYSECSRKIVYIKSLENVKNLWWMNLDGSENLQITRYGFINSFDYEKEGKEIAYSASKGNCNDKLYCIDTNSLEDRLVVDDSKIIKIKSIKYSNCGKIIAFIGVTETCSNLYVAKLDTRRVTNLTNFDCNISISDFIWKVDSTKIYYACDYLGYCNIFSITLDGCVKKQLTNSRSDKIQLDYRPMIR